MRNGACVHFDVDDGLSHNAAIHRVRGKRLFIDTRDDLIKRSLAEGHSWDEHVRRWMASHVRAGSVVVDVGAHIGYFTLKLADMVGPEGRVVAIEPQRAMVSQLLNNLWLNDANNVGVVHAAAGAVRTQLQMNPVDPANEGATGIGTGGQWVECIPVDELALDRVSLIKIDVESFEQQVLAGAVETIRAWRPVLIVEIMGDKPGDDFTRERRAGVAATVRSLLSLGYRLRQVVGQDYLAVPVEDSTMARTTSQPVG